MLSPSSEWVVNTKNTFLELTLPREDQKRTESCPPKWKTSSTQELAAVSQATAGCVFRPPSPSVSDSSTCATEGSLCKQGVCECSVGITAVDVVSQPAPWWQGRVWAFAQNRVYCRRLQAALDDLKTEEESAQFFKEMQGHVNEASRCPHANYVLQKCILVANDSQLQGFITELTRKGSRSATMVARHKYGCRILQRLFECCSLSQKEVLSNQLLESDVIVTCSHQYGNYVMQHLYEYGTSRTRSRLRALIQQDNERILNEHQCAVMTKILSVGNREDKRALANALPNFTGFTSCIAQTESGQLLARLARRIQQRL